jgi:hypothetical protein
MSPSSSGSKVNKTAKLEADSFKIVGVQGDIQNTP